jgi:hypothetical protein
MLTAFGYLLETRLGDALVSLVKVQYPIHILGQPLVSIITQYQEAAENIIHAKRAKDPNNPATVIMASDFSWRSKFSLITPLAYWFNDADGLAPLEQSVIGRNLVWIDSEGPK